MKINAYAANTAGARLRPVKYEPEPLGPDDVEVAITHCGICHSDVHLVDGDWGKVFPCVPGHEIVGTVVNGAGHPPGTRVGIGWQRSSCGVCEYCRAGDDELCADSQATCMHHFGGFADRIRVNRRFAIMIPAELPSEAAAPLLCGGITVYAPLVRHAGPGACVAVIGIGGLGHLALQFARALGCEVWAFSRREYKEADAHRLGAHHFSTGAPPRGALDLVLNTAHAVPNLEAFMPALRPRGVFCQLGATTDTLPVGSLHLISGRRTVCGSAIGSPRAIGEMLALAAACGIAAVTEVAAMTEANAALDRTRKNLARYRMVLFN
jgi:uncharacterized zinc-type alcohol dehydrogenase-like protein